MELPYDISEKQVSSLLQLQYPSMATLKESLG